MSSLTINDALIPRAPGGTVPGAAMSLLAHVALVAALAYGVSWRSPAPETISAELWAALPQQAAPQATATTPPVTPPAPTPKPVPVEKSSPPVAVPDPQIALEKARKEKLEKARLEKAEQARDDKLAREKLELDKQRVAKEKALADQKAKAAEDARLATLREDNLRRMMGQIGAASSPAASSPAATTGSGTAAASAGPSASYGGRLIAAIKPHIIFAETLNTNPAAVVEVRATASGTVIGRTLVKPSGVKEWDEAVLRAIDRTGALPRDTDGRVPPTLTITFRPRD